MIQPGCKNSICDVEGIRVGNAEDRSVRSGVTVILPDDPVTAAVDVRGGGPGTRETEALDPTCVVDAVHAVVLSGGSAYGLDAASGMMNWLRTRGRGFRVGEALIPIVPSAIIFDLLSGGDKNWGDEPPYRHLAGLAADDASTDFSLGNVGAGLGARAGELKGGLGTSSFVAPEFVVGSIAVANPLGSVLMPGTKTFWAWPYEKNNELGGQQPPAQPLSDVDFTFEAPVAANTTLAVVATDVALTKAQAQRVAMMAHDGFARAIRPVHSPLDGDSVFVLSTGKRALSDAVGGLAKLGMLAADSVARSIARGVYEADSIGSLKAYKDL